MTVDSHAPLSWDDTLTEPANRLLMYVRNQAPEPVTLGRMSGWSGLSSHGLEKAVAELLAARLIERHGARFRVADSVTRGDR